MHAEMQQKASQFLQQDAESLCNTFSSIRHSLRNKTENANR
jgi:hypothetical protein